MATRHERVIIDLDDRFTNPMARSTAATALFRREIDSSGKSVVAFDRTTKDLSPSIDRLSGRLVILTRAAAAVGPGIVPITTAAIPALAGLTSQLGFAVAGAGTTVLAFKGVGDALEAFREAQVEPTEENLAKMREEMGKLGPEAREFVRFLDQIIPQLQELRETAQAGVLPGVQDGIDALLNRAPQVRRILGEIADASGDLARATGQDLASGRWDEFFDFLEREARPTLVGLGQTVGNVASGLAELWMAFDPLSDDFTTGLLRMSQSFEAWASGLSDTEGFQDFLAYIRETGPQVVDLLGSLVDMLVSVGTAVAPLGGPVLTILTGIADAIATLADSDLGTPLLGAISAMSALSLATRGATSVMDAQIVTKARAAFSTKELTVATEALRVAEEKRAVAASRAAAAQSALIPTADKRAALVAYGNAQADVAAATQRVADAEQKRGAGIRASLGSLGRASALVGGLALATSDAGQNMGFTNTAALALMGTMAGPWGAAVGGAVGLTLDLAAANDVAVASADDLLATLNEQTGAITAATVASVDLALEQAGILEIAEGLGVALSDVSAAARGEEDAFARVNAQIDAHIAAMPEVTAGASGAAQAQQNAMDAADKLRGAISGQNAEVNDAVGSFRRLEEANDGTADAMRRGEIAASRQAAALKAARQAARETAQGFITLGDSLDDSKVSLRGWIREMERQARALRNFRRNAEEAANRGLRQGLIAALREAGPEGAMRLRQLANATDEQIDRANRAWMRGQRQIQMYIDATAEVPDPVPSKVDVEVAAAMRAIGQVQYALQQLHGNRATTYVDTVYTASGQRFKDVPSGVPAGADGMTVPGRRYPYGDKVLALLAPGEEVISNRYGQADRHRELLQQINANRYAGYENGGTVSHSSTVNNYGPSGPLRVTGRMYGAGGTYVDLDGVIDNRINANERHAHITGSR